MTVNTKATELLTKASSVVSTVRIPYDVHVATIEKRNRMQSEAAAKGDKYIVSVNTVIIEALKAFCEETV